MTIGLKNAALIQGLRPEIIFGLMIMSSVFDKWGQNMTITELTGGRHKMNSLHYEGLAADIRSKDIDPTIKSEIFDLSKRLLTPLFDLILESPGTPNEHFHLEYDPR